ncbi:MAG: LrgB family protein [Desulfovibrionaceae bacterium]
MNLLNQFWNSTPAQACAWSLVTIGLYLVVKRIYRRWRRWWQTPLALTPALLSVLIFGLHIPYREYYHATSWLVVLIGPATVAFAAPIYENRALIRRHWPILCVGMIAGSGVAILTSWAFATLLGIDGVLRLSLLPRSISMPFAMDVSRDIGGVADVTSVFVAATGVLGPVLGEFMAARLPLRSAMSRGAMLGVAAHAAGTAKAHELGSEEGSIAGLLMILVGMLNVFGAAIFTWLR